MTNQLINIGTKPGDGSGDPLRIAFNKINQNFNELYAAMAIITAAGRVDNGLLGPVIVDYGLVTDAVTTITDYGSI